MAIPIRFLASCLAMGIVAGGGSSVASPQTARQSLMHLERCMVDVLHKTPSVRIIKWYMPPSDVVNVPDFRFVAYSWHGNGILFEAEPSDGTYDFIAALPTGLHAVGAPLIPDYDWGTYKLEKRWKVECGADATTVIE